MSAARYVAMGSSFGAGPGLAPRVADSPRAAGRSTVNYAHLLAARLGLDLVDVTFSGATTAALLGADAHGRPAQLDAVTGGTRLVTITAGGNDIGYLGTLTLATLPRLLRGLPMVRARLVGFDDAAALDTAFAALRSSLDAVLQRIRTKAPDAQVVLVDYLTILPPDDSFDLGRLPARVADWARGVAPRLTATFGEAAAANGAVVLPMAERSADHHAWAPEPWTRRFHLGLRDGAPYHPTYAGMRAVADALVEVVDVGAR